MCSKLIKVRGSALIIKEHIKILSWCLTLIILSFVTYNIDLKLVTQDKRPVFVLPTAVAKDGGTTIYIGLGYKVIGWKRFEVRQVDGKEVFGRITGYEISTIFNPQEINKGQKKELKFDSNK
jgi:hypothetical protein